MARFKKADPWLSIVVFLLVVVGLVFVYSASVVISLERFGNPYHYLVRQAIALGVGLVFWFVIQRIDYHFWKKYSVWFLLLTLLLLVLVVLPLPFAPTIGGAKRWLYFGPINFQASELAKVFFVIYLASWLSSHKERMESFTKGVLPYWLIVGLIGFLILLEPDLGTATIFLGIGLILFFVAGARWSHFALVLLVGVLAVVVLSVSSPYRMHRLLAFINPENDPLGIGYHARNISIAVGSGGLWGLGFGQSRQKYFYLPEAHTDSIFAVIAEELGFLRSCFVILFFAFLIWRGWIVAKKAPDDFGRFLSLGIVSWFTLQALINLGGMIGVLPLTGVPLPFISYGGSSLVLSLAAVGILLNISRQRKEIIT
ncbi:putative lipid II flippase FtsW [bacterium]|nr:putative lipid II flippase FtsW [bacterium]